MILDKSQDYCGREGKLTDMCLLEGHEGRLKSINVDLQGIHCNARSSANQ